MRILLYQMLHFSTAIQPIVSDHGRILRASKKLSASHDQNPECRPIRAALPTNTSNRSLEFPFPSLPRYFVPRVDCDDDEMVIIVGRCLPSPAVPDRL